MTTPCLELRDLLEQRGFRVIAAAAFIAEHNIMRSVATGRPDEQDFKAIEKFAQEVVKKLAKINKADATEPLALKGNLPYREYNGVPFKPSADNSCVKCGLCAAKCPVKAIPAETPENTDTEKCTHLHALHQGLSAGGAVSQQAHALRGGKALRAEELK